MLVFLYQNPRLLEEVPLGVSPTTSIAFLTALASPPESQSIAPRTASMVVASKL